MITKETAKQLDTFSSESMQQVLDDNFQNCLSTVKPDSSNIEDKKYNHFILVTISSIKFKCLVLLHFQENNDFKDFIFTARDITSNISDQLFYDNLSEISNAIAGNLKRKLECSFSVIGMSTPKLLGQDALDFFLNSNPDYKTRVVADLDNRFPMGASFLLYVDNQYDFSIDASENNEDDMESGELLLF